MLYIQNRSIKKTANPAKDPTSRAAYDHGQVEVDPDPTRWASHQEALQQMKTECPLPGTIHPVQQRRRVVGQGGALVVVLLEGRLHLMACEHGGGLGAVAVMMVVVDGVEVE